MNDIKQEQLLQFYLNDLTGIDTTHDNRVKSHHPEYWKFNSIKQSHIGSSSLLVDLHITNPIDIWFWSDTHFWHKNIIRYSARPYPDIENMNEELIKSHNEVVGPNDIVIWGGDVGFASETKLNDIVRRCNGYKILIVGNHDFHRGGILYDLDFDEIHPCLSFTRSGITFWITHYPLDSVPANTINLHGHTHTHNIQSLQHINISVEQLEYKPVHLDNIVSIATENLELLKYIAK